MQNNRPPAAPARQAVPSGLPFLDERTGGLLTEKRYVFHAESGTARYLLTLQLIHAGLEAGESVLLITGDDPEAVQLQGERSGLPITHAIYAEQLMILRYDSRFEELVSRPSAERLLLEDMRRKLRTSPVRRVVFLGMPLVRTANVKVRRALAAVEDALLNQHRGTVLVHVLETDEAATTESGKELVRRAFGVYQIRPPKDDGLVPPRFLAVRDPSVNGHGLDVAITSHHGQGFAELPRGLEATNVLYVGDDVQLMAELAATMGNNFRFQNQRLGPGVLASGGLGARTMLVIEAGRSAEAALDLVWRVREGNQDAPVVVLVPREGRSNDRVRFLDAGVDQIILQGTGLAEMRAHLRRAAVRGNLIPAPRDEVRVLADRAELTSQLEGGTLPWGLFHRQLDEVCGAMRDLGGHFTILAVRWERAEADRGTSIDFQRGVLGVLRDTLRDSDPRTVSPDGAILVVLDSVSPVDPPVTRVRAQLAELSRESQRRVTVAVARFPHDGQSAADLLERIDHHQYLQSGDENEEMWQAPASRSSLPAVDPRALRRRAGSYDSDVSDLASSVHQG